uniref:Uncharacterized protein n=1 Tax=Macrostomum lignano TaxID=282301 RepID=A0A1I8FLN6_9PLAT
MTRCSGSSGRTWHDRQAQSLSRPPPCDPRPAAGGRRPGRRVLADFRALGDARAELHGPLGPDGRQGEAKPGGAAAEQQLLALAAVSAEVRLRVKKYD